MRETGRTISHLSQVRAGIVAAAIIAGFTALAHGQPYVSEKASGDITSGSTPAAAGLLPMAHAGSDDSGNMTSGIGLARPLSPSDVALMRHILALQAAGDIPAAARLTANLGNPLLLGALLADRLLGRTYRSSAADLMNWLDQYHDQPDAPAIRALLMTKLRQGTVLPTLPDVASLSQSADPAPDRAAMPHNDMHSAAVLDRIVIDRAQRGQAGAALRFIAAHPAIAPATRAQFTAEIAQVLFTRNENVAALRVVEESVRITPAVAQNSLTFYVGGLAAWRLDRIEQARRLFEDGANADISSARLRAATAFWASRANRRLQQSVATVKWLHRAAEERTTFHGILARRILRMDIGRVPNGELLTEADVDAVAATLPGTRAFGLLQIGQPGRADRELRSLWPQIQSNSVFGRSVLMVAAAAGLDDLAAQLASKLQMASGEGFDDLRFPMPKLRPAHGFRIDPALVYALARTESHFDTDAISPMGARGLMQIMPATAHYIAADLGADIPGRADGRLRDPSLNLEIGQRYICYLANLDSINADLIRLLASYNSGPSNVMRWNGQIRDKADPLLYIESIPTPETRAFVPDVLAASWIYASSLHRQMPSLDSLAAGDFPRFTPMGAPNKPTSVALSLR